MWGLTGQLDEIGALLVWQEKAAEWARQSFVSATGDFMMLI